MEAAGLWVAVVGACAAVAAAVFAFVQAKAATDGRKDAEAARDEARSARDESARLAAEANSAFVRQAAAQEEANRLKLKELTPEDWSLARGQGTWIRVTNTTGRRVVNVQITASPAELSGLVRIDSSHPDGVYEIGDSFRFAVIRLAGDQPEKLTISYRFESDPSVGRKYFHIPL